MPAEPTASLGACGAERCRAALRYLRLAGAGRGDPRIPAEQQPGVVPVDVGLDPAGALIPVVVGGERRVRPRRPGDEGRPGFTPHWESCPEPGYGQARGRAADPALRATAGGVVYGPCAGCGYPDHIAYGPTCTGTLCERCTGVLAAWRAAGARGPIPYRTPAQ
jgi:hypothetical protein